MNIKNNRFVKRLQAQAEENPTGAIVVATGALTALSYLMKANTERANSKTYRKEVDRRDRKDAITYYKTKK